MVKKYHLFPPLQIGNTLVSDFKMKANIFNKFFASQCVPLNNDSNIPYCQRYMTNAKICSIKFENKDIINVIKALDPCKAHGYDDISIRMLKICDSAIVKPLISCLKMVSVRSYFQIIGRNQTFALFTKKVINK